MSPWKEYCKRLFVVQMFCLSYFGGTRASVGQLGDTPFLPSWPKRACPLISPQGGARGRVLTGPQIWHVAGPGSVDIADALTGPQIWRLAGPAAVDIADALRPVRRKRPACRQAVRLAEVPGKVVCGVFGRAKSRTASNFRCAKLPGTKVPWSLPLQHPYWARLTHV